jgi:nitroimidazol reductase NimA-like FMN-containing flavoprotein (pyridoxamine 5'-phosphate oxidase superfamily)
MTIDPRNGMEILSPDQCWALLDDEEVGRLAVAIGGEVDIFPLNFVVADRTIVFRTAEGSKLAEIAANARVSFEIDGYDPGTGEAWSVVLKGLAQVLQRFSDIYSAEELPLFPWNAAPKQWFVRITPRELSGRRFTVVQEVPVD